MSERLEGKSFIVIGAGTGIGAATVRRLASEGARVCVGDINRDAAEAVAEQVRAGDGNAFAVAVDITDQAQVDAAVGEAVQRFGKLDGAHVNAADLRVIFQDSDALDVDMAVFDRTLDVNLRGHLRCTKAVLPHLLANGGGAIVYTTSAAGDAAEPTRPSYAASKSGLNALMRHVASRWGREGVRANAILPGLVLTPQLQSRMDDAQRAMAVEGTRSFRAGESRDIAAMVAMLMSRDGEWITGQTLSVNGGVTMRP